MKKGIRRILSCQMLCFSLIFIALLSLVYPIKAEAKTKSVTLKNSSYAYFKSNITERAKVKVKSGTTYKVSLAKDKNSGTYKGYLKFVAPKTKTYSITISKLTPNKAKNYELSGRVRAQITDNSTPSGLSEAYLNFGAKRGNDTFFSIAHLGKYSIPVKSTGKIKLKKGQTIFLFYEFTSYNKDTKLSSNLLIK